MTLAVGEVAPDFQLPDSQGQIWQLSQFSGQPVVLYFYPRDNTPGCTQEACSFRDSFSTYQERGIQVAGISTDSLRSHEKFTAKLQLPFPLLADEEAIVSRLYGVYGPKKFMGKEYEGITRTTFLINAEGLIAQVYSGRRLKVASHAQDLLQDLPC
jgi:peroxiredoxin Q/BCP